MHTFQHWSVGCPIRAHTAALVSTCCGSLAVACGRLPPAMADSHPEDFLGLQHAQAGTGSSKPCEKTRVGTAEFEGGAFSEQDEVRAEHGVPAGAGSCTHARLAGGAVGAGDSERCTGFELQEGGTASTAAGASLPSLALAQSRTGESAFLPSPLARKRPKASRSSSPGDVTENEEQILSVFQSARGSAAPAGLSTILKLKVRLLPSLHPLFTTVRDLVLTLASMARRTVLRVEGESVSSTSDEWLVLPELSSSLQAAGLLPEQVQSKRTVVLKLRVVFGGVLPDPPQAVPVVPTPKTFHHRPLGAPLNGHSGPRRAAGASDGHVSGTADSLAAGDASSAHQALTELPAACISVAQSWSARVWDLDRRLALPVHQPSLTAVINAVPWQALLQPEQAGGSAPPCGVLLFAVSVSKAPLGLELGCEVWPQAEQLPQLAAAWVATHPGSCSALCPEQSSPWDATTASFLPTPTDPTTAYFLAKPRAGIAAEAVMVHSVHVAPLHVVHVQALTAASPLRGIVRNGDVLVAHGRQASSAAWPQHEATADSSIGAELSRTCIDGTVTLLFQRFVGHADAAAATAEHITGMSMQGLGVGGEGGVQCSVLAACADQAAAVAAVEQHLSTVCGEA